MSEVGLLLSTTCINRKGNISPIQQMGKLKPRVGVWLLQDHPKGMAEENGHVLPPVVCSQAATITQCSCAKHALSSFTRNQLSSQETETLRPRMVK